MASRFTLGGSITASKARAVARQISGRQRQGRIIFFMAPVILFPSFVLYMIDMQQVDLSGMYPASAVSLTTLAGLNRDNCSTKT
jgi:hypothetical protein